MAITPILGESQSIKQLLLMIEKVANSKINVLILGESGTGKELVARRIHEMSPLAKGPFVPVNCGAIPETLMESEFFGHKRGSFTGAVSDKPGLFESAQGGTLFLDEVGEIPVNVQVKLLRALQEKTTRRVGSNEDVKVDARILSATNRDLDADVKSGKFREDLFYRINVIQLRTPPLRERDGDFELLLNYFLKRFSERLGKKQLGVSQDVLKALRVYRWPGNVRELENVVERAVTLSTGENVEVSVLPTAIQQVAKEISEGSREIVRPKDGGAAATGSHSSGGLPDGIPEDSMMPGGMFLAEPDFYKGPVQLDKILAEVENFYLQKALKHTSGIKKEAADLLGITFRSIRYRLGKGE